LQFLAFTLPVPESPAEAPANNINSLFFSFQFYRFRPVTTQRMSLVRCPDAPPGLAKLHNPRVLRKIASGEQLDQGTRRVARVSRLPLRLQSCATERHLSFLP